MPLLRQRLTLNTVTLITSTAGSTLLVFALSILIGRTLGEEGLGVYAATLAWIFPLSILSEFGIGTLITRDLAQQPEATNAYLRTAIKLRLLLGVPLLLLVGFGATGLSSNPDVVTGLRLSSPLILIQPLFGSFTAIFRARRQMWPIAGLNLGMLGIQFALTWLLLWLGYGIGPVLAINTLTSAGQLLVAAIIYRLWFYVPSTQQISARTILHAAAPFAIAAVLAATQARINMLLLEQFGGVVIVGIYAAGWRFVEAGRLLPHAFFDALYPLLAQLAQQPAKLKQLFRRVAFGISLYSLTAALILLVSAPLIITLTYGSEFIASIPVLEVAGFALLPLLLKGVGTLYWYAQGAEAYVNRVTALTIVLQLLIGLLLISRLGAIGAVLTTIIGDSLAVILLWCKPRPT